MKTTVTGHSIDPFATDPVARGYDVVAHASPLIVAIAAALIVGRPDGWIAFLLPIGPLFVSGIARLAQGRPPRAWRSLLAFATVSAVVIGGGWAITHLGQVWAPLSLLFPLGLLAFIAGLVNFVLVVLGRIPRAVRGRPFDYPWIPTPVARFVGLGEGWHE